MGIEKEVETRKVSDAGSVTCYPCDLEQVA